MEKRYSAFWRCSVIGEQKIRVAAGEFDTWKITCSRYKNSKKFPGALSWEDKTWYYAPEINHWVLEEQDYHGYRSSRRRELVAILPDLTNLLANEQDEVKQLFQKTLEFQESGESEEWRSKDLLTAITFTPVKSFKHASGGVCRQYMQEISAGRTENRLYGIACKSKEGSWQIPRR